MHLVDRAFGLVGVDLSTASILFIRVSAEIVFWLSDHYAVIVNVNDAVAERRIEPQALKVQRVLWHD